MKRRVVRLALLAGVAASCSGKPELGVEVSLPRAVADATAWIEVGVYDGACIEGQQLGGGLPLGGALTRTAFRFGEPKPPTLGSLKRGKYAFAAVARRDDCAVVATGCTTLDVSEVPAITLTLQPLAEPSGTCGLGSICQSARCVPGLDSADPSVGAGCSLQFLGAGPLTNPLSAGSTLVSAPAIAATANGFVVALREYDAAQGQGRLTILALDNGGGSRKVLGPDGETLDKRCPSTDESDPVGIAMHEDTGMIVVSRRECPSSPAGLDLFAINTSGEITKRGRLGFGSARIITLSNAHALAPIAGSKDYLLAAVVDNTRSQLARIKDVTIESANDFGGVPPMSGALVATSEKVLALIARSPQGAAPPDAGLSDGGGGPSAGTSLRVNVVAAGTPTNELPFPTEFEGSWASMAAQATRVVVASDGASVGRPVALRIYDLPRGATKPIVAGFAPEGLGKITFADVALRQDHLFLAVEQPGAITLAAFNRATTTPTLLREVQLARDPRVPSIARVRGGRLAVAASDTRVGVVWTTTERLENNDVVGGYAVFACRTP